MMIFIQRGCMLERDEDGEMVNRKLVEDQSEGLAGGLGRAVQCPVYSRQPAGHRQSNVSIPVPVSCVTISIPPFNPPLGVSEKFFTR